MKTYLLMEVIFWLSGATLAYAYAGYPLLLWVVSRVAARPVRAATPTDDALPFVSVIITAYNEQQSLAAKLDDTLALDYPADKLEIIVASDCSSDSTDEIARSYASRGVRLHRQVERLGKTAAQNAAVEVARGEIILFSDATTLYDQRVLRRMIPLFSDSTIGCVAGRLIYIDPANTNTGQGARSYWNYETFLKTHESRVCSLIGASGCLYAVRRTAYIPLYHEACSDFLIATKMVEQGLRAVYEPGAVCTEETNERPDKEFRMRVRVITQTFTDLWRHRYMMNPLRSGFYAVQLLSHKVLRYLVPFMLLINFGAALGLAAASRLYLAAALSHVAVYGAALVGWMLARGGIKSGIFVLPYYFALANLAAACAFYKFASGERYARWETQREGARAPAVLPKGSEG